MFSGVHAFANAGSSAFHFLCNVTSGSFLEADQLWEINFPLLPHACNMELRGIIYECDITQKYFRSQHHHRLQIIEGHFGGMWGCWWNTKSRLLTFQHQRRIVGLLICNLSAQKQSIPGWIWFAFLLYLSSQGKLYRRIISLVINVLFW